MFLSINISYSANESNKYSLINAVKDNSFTKTKRLIADNYDINLKDASKNTALTYAIQNENFDIARLLLRNGADPKIKDDSGKNIYCSAMTSSDFKIRRLFEGYDSEKCNKQVAKKRVSGSNNEEFNVDWRYILGGSAVAGGIVALVAMNNNGSGDSGDSGSNRFSPADRNYGIVGQVNDATLNNILADDQYSKNWNLSGNNFSNKNSFNSIRLAYSLARGYTGKVVDTSGGTLPYYLTPGITSTSIPLNTKIKVAVLDSGVQTAHEDFGDGSGGSNITSTLTNTNLAYLYCTANPTATGCALNSYNQNNPNPTTLANDPKAWHGTFVASLIGASYSNNLGVTGVAPDSEIIPYRLTLNNGNFVSDYYIGEAFRYATGAGAVVINNSYGTPTRDANTNVPLIDASDVVHKNFLYYFFGDNSTGAYNPNNIYTSNYIDQMLNAVRQDVVFVWSAGNDGNSQPSIEASIPLYFSEFNDGDYYKNFIVVVAYDSDNKTIASYSNHCGITKEYCLTAPGTNVVGAISGTTNDGYGSSSGTSFSTPLVSGAVAVLKGAFPYLTGAEITKLLFITARDLGTPGVDEVYGWGMLDLERATRPVGTTLVPVDNRVGTAGFGLAGSTMQLNSNLAKKIKEKNINFVILDSFNRTFTMKLNEFIEEDKYHVRTIDILKKFGENKPKSIAINKDKSFNFYVASTEESKPLSEFEFSYTPNSINDNNYGFSLYYGNNPYNAFVNDKVNLYENFSLANAYNYNIINPYFRNDSDINFGFNNMFQLSEKSSMSLGVLYQNYTMDYDQIYTNKKMRNEDMGASFSILTAFNYKFNDNISSKIETGFLNEFDTIFGSKMNGAFGIGQNNLTYMIGMHNDINLLNNKVSLFGRANLGYTSVNNAESSLVKNVSGLISNTFSIGFNYNFDSKYVGEKSNVSLLLVQPVRIVSGDMEISLPIARDTAGNLYYAKHKVDLSDDSRINLQLSYNHSIKDDNSFSAGVVYKEDYKENEYIMLLKYKRAFSF